MIGEFLYNLSDKEAVSQPTIQRVTVREVVSQADAAFVMEHDVPADRALILEHAWITASTAGVALANDLVLTVRNAQLQPLFVVFSRFFSPALINTRTTSGVNGNLLTIPILLMPTDKLHAAFGFNTPAVGNIGEVHYSGLLVPRGTLQYGSLTRSQ